MSTIKRFTLPVLRAYLASKPAKTWNDHIQHEGKTCCVLGHLEDLTGMGDAMLWDDRDPHGVLKPFKRLAQGGGRPYAADIADRLASINNGTDSRYQQKTPRARVLAVIDDLIARTVPRLP